MTFKLFIIPAVALSIIYGFAMASAANAEATVTVQTWKAECALVEDMVECDISSDYGISNVHVFMNAGIGSVTVFDQDYEDCPTEVHVILDPIVLDEDSDMDVTTCGSVENCEGCIVCISGECPSDLPGVGVSRPDSLPFELRTDPGAEPIVHADSFTAHK